jgi:hypothetical protein
VNFLTHLREAASKATPGEWASEDGGQIICIVEQLEPALPFPPIATTWIQNGLSDEQNINNGDFISLANPANVLRLLDALEVQREALEQIQLQRENFPEDAASNSIQFASEALTRADAILEGK